MGFKKTDTNGKDQLGFGFSQTFIKDGIRSSTDVSYIVPNPYPNNFDILTHAFVLKILIKMEK